MSLRRYPLRVKRAFARLVTASRGPSVGRQRNLLATNGSAEPQASARNEVAAPRAAGPSGRTVSKHGLYRRGTASAAEACFPASS